MQLLARARFLLFAGILAGCGTTTGPSQPAATAPASQAASPSLAPTNRPTQAVVATAAAHPIPAITPIEPAAVIDVPGSDIIWMTTDGQTLWATTTGAILRIDAATNAVTSLKAPSVSGDTTVAIADDGLWMTRWSGGRVYRVDPSTGEVELSTPAESPVKLTFIGDDLWVGLERATSMVLFDRLTGDAGRSLTFGARGVAGLGDLWFASTGAIKRVDPASGAVRATIPFQDEGNCGVSGEFPDNAWISCFGRQVVPRAATRLDAAANTVAVVAGLPAGHGGSVTVINGTAWFVGTFEDADRKSYGGLLLLNSETGAVEKFLSFHGDPDGAVVAGGAIWVAEEAGHTIQRFDLEDLTR